MNMPKNLLEFEKDLDICSNLNMKLDLDRDLNRSPNLDFDLNIYSN